MAVVFILIHIIALFTIPLLLVITIPLHIIASSSSKRSQQVDQIQEQLQSQEKVESYVGQDSLELEFEEKATSKQKKWDVAKLYTSEVKDGLEFIFSKVKEVNKGEAENALKEVFFELGISAINEGVLENIIAHVNENNNIIVEELEKVEEKTVEESTIKNVQIYSEEELIQRLYSAVEKSKLNLVVDILSQNLISTENLSKHKKPLKALAKKRGDNAMQKLIVDA